LWSATSKSSALLAVPLKFLDNSKTAELALFRFLYKKYVFLIGQRAVRQLGSGAVRQMAVGHGGSEEVQEVVAVLQWNSETVGQLGSGTVSQ
jgi:hypothetical protein